MSDSANKTSDKGGKAVGERPSFFKKLVSGWIKQRSDEVKAQAARAVDAAEDLWEQRDQLADAVPERDQLQSWVREKAQELRDTIDRPDPTDLEKLEEALTGVVAAIQQVSNKHARKVTGIAISNLGAAATYGGITALISEFGIASTGTAIASLSGAAATTAQLYWIGSFVGMGVAAGGVIVASTGIGASLAAAYFGKRYLLGSRRKEEDLQDYERAILASCVTLLAAVRQQNELGKSVTKEEMRVVAEQALIPQVQQIDTHMSQADIKKASEEECRSFQETLSPLNLRKLRTSRDTLANLAIGALV